MCKSVSIIKSSIKKYGNAKVCCQVEALQSIFIKNFQKLDFKKISFGLIDEHL